MIDHDTQQNKSISRLLPAGKRILVVTGHYGSGKSEFAVSLALLLASEQNRSYQRLAIADLDIVNPYFRSRDCKQFLNKSGIAVYGNCFSGDVTAEIPALAADVRAPLEDKDCFTIVDAGGNDSGARVLHQFRKYLQRGDSYLLAVVNANRPETRNFEGALEHIAAIEQELSMPVDAIVNNCHLLNETKIDDIRRGHLLCCEICAFTEKKLFCDCYPAPLINSTDLSDIGNSLLPLGMYLRASYLDK